MKLFFSKNLDIQVFCFANLHIARGILKANRLRGREINRVNRITNRWTNSTKYIVRFGLARVGQLRFFFV